jgi:hypothetical protein
MKFTKLQAACDKANAALRAAIDRAFPVGSRVRVKCGRGWMHGTVSHLCSYRHDVAIISDATAFRESVGTFKGRRIKRKHYSLVELSLSEVRGRMFEHGCV